MPILTEKSNPATADIDLLDGKQIAKLINDEDKKVALAVEKILPEIGKAIDEIADRFRRGGRLAYFGAGTSGRIGVLDASEMPPTFGVSKDLVSGYIAGGERAVRNAVENAEDSAELAEKDFAAFNPGKNDIVVSVSASGNPEYAVEILRLGRKAGVLTTAVTSNPEAKLKQYADIFLCTAVGPEAITGSSRMKSGTAQKMVLNMLSTGAMVRTGKTYRNYMVDLKISNEKLRDRAVRIVSEISKTDTDSAKKALETAQNVKTACVMLIKKCDKAEAEEMLSKNDGILRKVI